MDVNVKVEDVSPVKKKLSFEIPWDDVKKELDSAYQTVGKKAKIKGFRPGKTPRKVLETYYKDEAEGEAISNLINKNYWDALEKNNITPTSQPTIDQSGIKPESDYVFSATVEAKPAIEPKDYLGIELEKEQAAVGEADIDKRIDELRNMYSTLEEIGEDHPAATGDFASIDFQGSVEGKELDSLKSENYLLEIGSKRFIPGFEEELIGLKKGEEKEFTSKFPDDYRAEDLAGKEATFRVKIKDLKQKRIPELDDNFLKNFEKYETLADLKEDIRKSLEEEQKHRINSEFNRKLIDKLLESNPIEVPATMVERQVYYLMMTAQRRMAYDGIEPKKAAELTVRMKDSFKPDAERQVKASLILEAIAKKESMGVDEEEVNKRLAEMAARNAQDIDSVREYYEKNDLMESLRAEIIEQKTLDFIEQRAKITDVAKKSEKED